MRFYGKLYKPIPLAVLFLGIVLLNPLHIPPDSPANAEEIVVEMKPAPIERNPESAKDYARKILHFYGWDNKTQWTCLESLWTKESNWRPDAYNKQPVYQNGKKLNAGGIPQILGLNPDISVENQIERGFLYIQSRYSSPCSAWSFWSRNFWYQAEGVDDETKPSIIDDALAEIGRIAFEDPAICTGWVLVAEWFGGNKDHWTIVLGDDENPDWRQKGLLHHALETWGDDEVKTRDDNKK